MSDQATVHISSDPGVCGGKPCITGTRIRVWDVHVWHNLQGQSPAEIVQQFPQLSVSDVYAALAYYLDHQDEIDTQMAQVDRDVDAMINSAGPSLLDQIRQKRQANADVPS